MKIPTGAWVDLDNGLVLPRYPHERFTADVQFDRDGRGFFMQPLQGGMPATADAESPEGQDWSTERQRMTWRDKGPRSWFVKTDRGSVARITLSIVDPYSTASATLVWALAPPASPVFLAAPTDLSVRSQKDGLHVSWSGSQSRYLVEADHGTRVDKRTVEGKTTRFDHRDPNAAVTVRVRGIESRSVYTLPATAVCWATRPAVRGVVDYPDRWYDATGGISLTRGTTAEDDAEVIFYLYGVYVPGGGVTKAGEGREAFRSLVDLPPDGYEPSYGRLDHGDVLAVRLADGRYGKVWLDAVDGSDLRSGMRVHSTFLPDGRRKLLPRPGLAKFERVGRNLHIEWQPVAGVAQYKVYHDGAAPLVVKQPKVVLRDVAADQFHVVELAATGPNGDESDRRIVQAHTFGERFRLGAITMSTGGNVGFDFTDDKAAQTGPAGVPPELELRITNSAGGASSLRFEAPYGAAPAGDLGFGVFPDDQRDFATQLKSREGDDGSEIFLVKTREGELVSVRIRKRGHPVTQLEYVFVARRISRPRHRRPRDFHAESVRMAPPQAP